MPVSLLSTLLAITGLCWANSNASFPLSKRTYQSDAMTAKLVAYSKNEFQFIMLDHELYFVKHNTCEALDKSKHIYCKYAIEVKGLPQSPIGGSVNGCIA
ncbi:hypothetical protein SprV_0902754000 [Sparganum proliferum]